MNVPRNILEERLQEFPQLALGGTRAFERRGRWREFLKRDTLIFEIGCNDAQTLCAIAAKFPDIGFVGLDWKFKSLYLAAARASEMKLTNVMFLRARAQDVAKIFAPEEVDEVWLFHPDPCDKPKELPNRLFAEPFLRGVHEVLRGSGARLCLKTDHPGYHQWALAMLGLPEPDWTDRRVKRKELAGPEAIPPRSDAVLERFDVPVVSHDFWNDPGVLEATRERAFAGSVTPFEKRFRDKRLPIYYVELAKKA